MPNRGRQTTAAPTFQYLPQVRNPNFCGRQRVLETMHKSLMSGGSGRVQVVYGAGGVGKTQLALEYAYRYIEQYPVVWWLPANEPNTLASFYLALAEQLGVIEAGNNDVAEARAAVCAALAQRDDWLLIFDDAPGADAVRPYIPDAAGGHVLVTSRNAEWKGLGKSFCLRVLERADAIEFLIRRSGRAFEPSAFTLCQALGDLPLALEQAGAGHPTPGTA